MQCLGRADWVVKGKDAEACSHGLRRPAPEASKANDACRIEGTYEVGLTANIVPELWGTEKRIYDRRLVCGARDKMADFCPAPTFVLSPLAFS